MKYIASLILLVLVMLRPFASFAELLPYCENGKWGFVDEAYCVRIAAQFDEVSYFRANEIAKVGIRGDDGDILYGLIDSNGVSQVPCNYIIMEGEDEAFFGGIDGYYAIVNPETGLLGYYSIKNAHFCEPKYGDIGLWAMDQSDVVFVKDVSTGFYVYLHAEDESLIHPFSYQYIECGYPQNGKAIAMDLDGNEWVQSVDGTRVAIDSNMIVDSAQILHGMFIVSDEEQSYLMDTNGKVVSNGYPSIDIDSYGQYVCQTDEGEELIPIKCDD